MKSSALVLLGVLTGSIIGALADSSSSSSEGGDSCGSSQNGPPNIVFFMSDALGWDDIGWHNDEVDTPFLDSLAAGGVQLEQYYTQGASTPARSSFFTGYYPFRIGRQHNSISGLSQDCLDLDLTILPQYLKDLDYKTHMLGKWGLGFCKQACTPRNRGFDTFYGQYGSVGDHYAHELVGIYDWRENEDLDTSARGTYAAELITDRALDIIDNHDCDDPLYLQISYPLPSTAITRVPPGEASVWDPTQGEDTPEERQDYLKMLKYMDGSAEQIVQSLQTRGLYDNTIFIFASDVGGQQYVASSNFPLRGGRQGSYEGGTRVVAMVNSPLMTSTGRVSNHLMHVVDWVPTILSLAGSTADLSDLDGVDQSDMLMNGGSAVRDEIVYNIDVQVPFTYGAAVLRTGNYKIFEGYPGQYDGWKQDNNKCYTHKIDLLDISSDLPVAGQVFPCEFPGRAGTPRPRTDITNYANLAIGNVMLFDLSVDEEERIDLSDSTDPVIMAKKAEMLSRLAVLKALATADSNPARPDSCDPRKTGQDNWEVGCCEGVDL